MSSSRLEYLFARAALLEASENELTELQEMLEASRYDKQVQKLMAAAIAGRHPIQGIVSDQLKQDTLRAIFSIDAVQNEESATAAIDPPGATGLAGSWRRYAIASMLVLALIVFSWLQFSGKKDKAANHPVPVAALQPGARGAVLTLADGSSVVLDTMQEGVIAKQPGATIVLRDGLLSYDRSGNANASSGLNTMTTPPGRQFQLKLPDGTRIWMNAASSITYPSSFHAAAREVRVNGEIYFEVAANKNRPFIVHTDERTQITVTGTSFNVQAHANEGVVRTTLLEGAVVVKQAAHLQQLRPGQQAVLTNEHPVQLKQGVNLQQVMAWKQGLFDFTQQDMKAVMNEIGRWYDLRIIFENEPRNIEIVGEIQRSLTLDQLLNVLQRLGIQSRLEGKTLFVS